MNKGVYWKSRGEGNLNRKFKTFVFLDNRHKLIRYTLKQARTQKLSQGGGKFYSILSRVSTGIPGFTVYVRNDPEIFSISIMEKVPEIRNSGTIFFR